MLRAGRAGDCDAEPDATRLERGRCPETIEREFWPMSLRAIVFEPLMTLYLTDHTTQTMVSDAAASPFVHGIKLYPAGATTNSDAG